MNLRRAACKGPPLPSALLQRRRGSGLLGHALSAKKIVHAINWYLFAPLSIAAGTAPAAGAAHSQATLSNEDRVSYLDNGVIRLGVNLELGGAITYLSISKSYTNLINSYDWGRQIQMSHYSGPVPFAPNGKQPKKEWAGLGWNPIQCGDCFGNRAKILEHRNNGRELYVKCIPMQWPLDNEPGECTFECWIRLKHNTAQVRSRMVNNRADKTQYDGRGQELPAVYTCGPWYRLMTYTNDRPFSGGGLAQIPAKFPWSGWTATENWAALVDDSEWGLGIWEPGTFKFIGGFAGKPGAGGPKDGPTGYIAPLQEEILDWNIDCDYNYTLIVGRLEEIRKFVYAHSSKHKPPHYRFKKDRQHWRYRNATDSGWPIKGELNVRLEGNDPQLIGPAGFWRAEDAPRLHIEAACAVSQPRGTIFWSRLDRPSFSSAQSVDFYLIADNKFHHYAVELAASTEYRGIITGLRFDPVPAGKPGEFIRIKSISVK